MMPPKCFCICWLFVTESSLSIWAASEMLDMGVFSSCVMLLMKSFLISVYRFWRNITTMVKMNVMSSTNVNTNAGIMKRTLDMM